MDNPQPEAGHVEIAAPVAPTLRSTPPKLSRFTEKRKSILLIIGAGVVLLGFVVRDGALEKAKEARSTQTGAKSVLVEASELVNLNGQISVFSAGIIESENLSTSKPSSDSCRGKRRTSGSS
jgi:hypothetical protein